MISAARATRDKTGEPPLIERVAAQMPVERVIDRMNCPSDDEANERDADAVRPDQREQHADADADLEGADVMEQMLVVGRKVDKRVKRTGMVCDEFAGRLRSLFRNG